jgi:hypothetical protein
MALSSQKPKMRLSGDDFGSRRARYHGLRAVARALGLRDFVELRRPRSRPSRQTEAPRQARARKDHTLRGTMR